MMPPNCITGASKSGGQRGGPGPWGPPVDPLVLPSPPAQSIRDQSKHVIPPSQTEKNWAEKKVKLITTSQEPVKPNRNRFKLKKNNFFDQMLSECNKLIQDEKKSQDSNSHHNNDNDDMEIVEFKCTSGYIFNLLPFNNGQLSATVQDLFTVKINSTFPMRVKIWEHMLPK